jgi:glycerol-3-phosphate dehydrogenase
MRYEMALTLKDIIFRRFELDFSNKCLGNDKIVEKIADIMQSELKWSDELKQNEVSELKKELQM